MKGEARTRLARFAVRSETIILDKTLENFHFITYTVRECVCKEVNFLLTFLSTRILFCLHRMYIIHTDTQPLRKKNS